MTASPTNAAIITCLLVVTSGCASLQSAGRKALGIGDKQMREAERLQRAERAGRLSEEQVDRRLTFLTERLDERRLHAAAWKYGWLTVTSAGGIASATRAGFEDGTKRVNGISQAGKALIGVTYLLFNPMPGVSGADPVREMPDATRADRVAQLVAAEDLLAREAERAHDRSSWLLYFGVVFINAAAAAPVLACGDEGLAAQSFGIGTAVGALQVLSQPWNGPADWEEYQRFVDTDGAVPSEPTTQWHIAPHDLGLAITARF